MSRTDTFFGCFGSGYWPNVEGLAAVLAPSLAFLPPHARLVVTGRLGFNLKDHAAYRRGRLINDSRLVHFDHLPPMAYDALVASCDALLLPVFVGSGSPLKTADALASGRPVLMSQAMARGYEEIIAACGDGVMMAEDAPAFRRQWQDLVRMTRAELQGLVGAGDKRRKLLSWERRLEPFVTAIEALARP